MKSCYRVCAIFVKSEIMYGAAIPFHSLIASHCLQALYMKHCPNSFCHTIVTKCCCCLSELRNGHFTFRKWMKPWAEPGLKSGDINEHFDHTLYFLEDLLLFPPHSNFSSISRKILSPSWQSGGGNCAPKPPMVTSLEVTG